jgi:hypothetical protein
MTRIWRDDGNGWTLAAPTTFTLESDLHDLVFNSPQVLPLAGQPDLVVLGREVRLGNGYADLLAVESTGRPVVIEVKLRNNAESRRAVIAQIMTYAAYLYRLEVTDFEALLTGHLQRAGFASVVEAVHLNDQAGAFDIEAFTAVLEQSLATGRFRLVLVLDEAPTELVELVGYLEAVADQLTIDLVTVSQYEIEGSRVLVPQRIDPERRVSEQLAVARATTSRGGYLVDGSGDFNESIGSAPPAQQERLRQLASWAETLERDGLVRLYTYHGKDGSQLTLLPRLQPENVGLVTIWNNGGVALLQFWRSVFARRAPHALVRVNEILAPASLGQGNSTRDFSDELLSSIADAYREAAGYEAPSPSSQTMGS